MELLDPQACPHIFFFVLLRGKIFLSLETWGDFYQNDSKAQSLKYQTQSWNQQSWGITCGLQTFATDFMRKPGLLYVRTNPVLTAH